jgi:hypothetical protein
VPHPVMPRNRARSPFHHAEQSRRRGATRNLLLQPRRWHPDSSRATSPTGRFVVPGAAPFGNRRAPKSAASPAMFY